MAHLLEMDQAGNASMAWVGETPWHGLGKKVPRDLTPEQMLEAAGLNWEVKKFPAYSLIPVPGYEKPQARKIDRSSLVRLSDYKTISEVSNDWEIVQNREAAEFFNDFCMAGDMYMDTAGSISEGQVVWFLAKINESFELFGGDKVDAYLLFTNYHKYGFSTDIRFTPIRVVCNNTLTLSMNTVSSNKVKFSHRKKFDPAAVKDAMGISKNKLEEYKKKAEFLGSKRAKNEDIVAYFKRLFPHSSAKKDNIKPEETLKMSQNASRGIELVHSQPGAKFAEGSWWQPFNAVTHMVDHHMGNSLDTRLYSAWYGQNRNLKTNALEMAMDMAEAA